MQPAKNDKKINPFYPIAWAAFVLIPAFTFYQGWKQDSSLVMLISGVAMLGFISLIWIAVRHNRKIARRSGK